jgi:hypothetical protein
MSPTVANKTGMSSKEKGMIVFVVLAVLLAGVVVYRTMSPDQGHAAAKITVPMEAMPKGAWMKAQKSGKDTSSVPGPGGSSSGSGQ